MGEMMLRDLDDGLVVELTELARRRGLAVDALAGELLQRSVSSMGRRRADGARAIVASQVATSPLDSVDILRDDHRR